MSFLLITLYIFCTIIRPQDWVLFLLEKPLINWLAIAIVIVLVIQRTGARSTFLMKVPHNIFMLGLFFCVLMSHVSHTYFRGLINSFNDFIVPFLLFFIVLNSLDRKWKLWAVLWEIIILASVLVWQGIVQLKAGVGWAGQIPTIDLERDEVRINWIGIFNDPNDLALLFVMAVGFLLPLVFRKSNFFIKLLSMALIAWLGYGVYLTNSRGGYLALMATVFFFFVRLTNKMFWGSILGGIGAVAVFLLGPSRLGLISSGESSAYGRLELWYWGLQKMLHNPFFGVGYNMFMEDQSLTAHNSYVLAAAELGFIGLFMWVGLIYISHKGLSIVYQKSDSLKTIAMGIQSSLVGFCVAAFFLSRTYVILPYLLFALSGAVMHHAKQTMPDLDLNFYRKDYWKIFWICVAILVVIYVFYKTGLS